MKVTCRYSNTPHTLRNECENVVEHDPQPQPQTIHRPNPAWIEDLDPADQTP